MDNLESYSVSIALTQSSIESEGLAVDADVKGKYSSLQPLCTRLCDGLLGLEAISSKKRKAVIGCKRLS